MKTPTLYRFEAGDLFHRAAYCETDAWFTATVEHSVSEPNGSQLVTLVVQDASLRRRDGTVVRGKLYGSPRHEGGTLSSGDGYVVSEHLADGSRCSIGVMSVYRLA